MFAQSYNACPHFSIILPIFNVENYLRQSIDSILIQTYSDYEIILVDDGSPDACPDICDEYASIYPRIKVVHKVNGGSSDARNIGLQNAAGEYVIFLDSDDFWCNKEGLANISRIINEFKNPDVVVFGVKDYNNITGTSTLSRGVYDEAKLNRLSKSRLIKDLVMTKQFPGASWMQAVRRDFLISHNIAFEIGVTAEDFDWLVKVYGFANQIRVCNSIIYSYRKNVVGSITSKPRVTGIYGIHNAISNWIMTTTGFKDRYISANLADIYLQGLLSYAALEKELQKEVEDIIYRDAVILNLSYLALHKFIYVACRVLGVNILATIVRFIYTRLKK